jgi:Domain of unknown function (DUF4389)
MTTAKVSLSSPYPVRVDAALDGHLSRWLWLVKWVLVIPHYVVLAFLWVAFALFSVVAFVAILFTGRYPKTLFDFNVGVLRWSWRVSYYSYGALGTDRYPPFTLRDVPDYPAHLEVPYPERLSRGLVLVKWWLLAIPHYLVLAVFAGGGTWLAWHFHHASFTWAGGGLIGLLVLIAGVSLLVRGRYPSSIFDIVLGLNRWALRVAAYSTLMTDTYPPFRLDQGGDDPGTVHVQSPPGIDPSGPVSTTPPAGPPTARTDPPMSRWSTGRVIAAVVGALMLCLSAVLGFAGTAALVADQTLRDNAGYLTSPQRHFSTPAYALATSPIRIDDVGGPDALYIQRLLGDVRLRITPDGRNSSLFVGLAAARDANRYLADIEHATIRDVGDGHTAYLVHSGAAPQRAPGTEKLWVDSASGPGTQTLHWPVRQGDWTVVVMNTDGTRGLVIKADIGATVPHLTALAIALMAAATFLLVAGCVVIYAAVARARSGRQPTPQTT